MWTFLRLGRECETKDVTILIIQVVTDRTSSALCLGGVGKLLLRLFASCFIPVPP